MMTEPATSRDVHAELYSVICDVVERAWHHWPVERQPDEAPVFHTSAYARAAANRVIDKLDELAAAWEGENG